MGVTAEAIARMDYVDNSRLRGAIERAVDLGVLTWASLATEVGVTECCLARSFGKTKRGGSYVSYGRAVQVARALGLDPVDVGL